MNAKIEAQIEGCLGTLDDGRRRGVWPFRSCDLYEMGRQEEKNRADPTERIDLGEKSPHPGRRATAHAEQSSGRGRCRIVALRRRLRLKGASALAFAPSPRNLPALARHLRRLGRRSAGSRRGTSHGASRGCRHGSLLPSAWTISRNRTPDRCSAHIAAARRDAYPPRAPALISASRAARCAALHRPVRDFISR